MSADQTLRERVDHLLTFTQEKSSQHSKLAHITRQVEDARNRQNRPMQVAIVGLIKAGKSTLVNAILGEEMVPTGRVETTFNVNWLQYHDQPALEIHFKDGRPPESRSFAELDELTRPTHDNFTLLRSIRHVVVFYPSQILNQMHLIDTPGLESTYEDDSDNTREFLAIHGDAITERTQSEASQADAVLYLFSLGVHIADKDAITHFHGPSLSRATPINAIGVLTKVDNYWSANEPDNEPLDIGKRVARRIAGDAQVERLFHGVYPVCGLLAFGARTLHDEAFEQLAKLASVPTDRLQSLLMTIRRFRTLEFPDVPVPPEQRATLADRLGAYGIWAACSDIREGVDSIDDLRTRLLNRSGLPVLERVVTSHFGNRSYLIKLERSITSLGNTCFTDRQRLNGNAKQIVEEIAGEVERLKVQEHVFAELRLLGQFYEGQIELSEHEARHLLQITGEYGTSIGQRLGLTERATIFEMEDEAHSLLAYWRTRANDFAATRQVAAAARVLERSYEHLLYHLREARRHLYLYE